jgi:hypothetical protein
MLLLALLWIGVVSTGWWGRYDLPLVAGLIAAGTMTLIFDLRPPGLDAIAMGLILGYMRRPVVHPDWPRWPQ